jgi:peptide-methionine (S)-S-oxide reductase
MTEKATFAAGCFWQVEADFRRVEGVTRTTAGYTGGTLDQPSYEDVCTDRTGHAEAVLVEFDPDRVSYDELLQVFWKSHDPTQLNRQGPDVGSQYRSAIFVHDEAQERAARESKEEAQGRLDRPVVTEIVPGAEFWPAEDYHQRYLEKRGLASCTLELAQTDAVR